MANVKKIPVIDIESLWDKDRTICSVEIKFSANFNYRFFDTSFPDDSRTSISVSLSIDPVSSIEEFKSSLVQEVTGICNSWKIRNVLNDDWTIEEWEKIQQDFLNQVINYISGEDYKPSSVVFVDKRYGMTFAVECHLYFLKQVAFI